jgi:hypothetical protein
VWTRAQSFLRQLPARLPWAALAVFVASMGALVWRVLSWPPSQSPDAWAYVAWGQALAAGERPAFAQSLTTPKPLGTVLGALVSPLPPQRAFQAAVIVSLAALAAALFWVAYRLAGTIGATVALAALGFSAGIATSLRSALVDGIAAALVMLALATRGRTRLVCLIVVGLGRPEAWPLAGVAAYADGGGSVRRRLVHAALATAAAPLIWILTDVVLTGDPLATIHRTNAVVSVTRGGHTSSLASLPRLIVSGLGTEIGVVVAILGGLGLAAMAVRGARDRSFDPLPLAILVVWTLGIFAETKNVAFQARFVFPMAAPLLVGFAFVIGALLRGRLRGPGILAVVCASGAFAVGLHAIPQRPSHYADLLAAIPSIDRVLHCGRLRVVGYAPSAIAGHNPGAVTPILAALTHTNLNRFVLGRGGGPVAGVMILGHGKPPAGWVRHRFVFGSVGVSGACAAAAA